MPAATPTYTYTVYHIKIQKLSSIMKMKNNPIGLWNTEKIVPTSCLVAQPVPISSTPAHAPPPPIHTDSCLFYTSIPTHFSNFPIKANMLNDSWHILALSSWSAYQPNAAQPQAYTRFVNVLYNFTNGQPIKVVPRYCLLPGCCE